ncbi:MSHA pilin protein MshD [Vibrio sp. RC586]|uniref:type IV pilus modification PilV family protein n=1 Tax=Vibrio sp. RC586 TaxID=675815 RepID=UPI0001BB7FCB|nr:type II secretion system protein [Vibrio sp. RC586]EEZ01347.1 MSHA pilin protein MshD [Vibrio sp. RC586]
MPAKAIRAMRGFTLIEMVIVIVVLGIALVGVSTALYPRSQQTAEQVLSVKAAELGRAVLDEILSRNFDQQSGPNGGLPECVIISMQDRKNCTAPSELGDDGEMNNTEFNDVDDYITTRPISVTDVLGSDISGEYPRFTVSVQVFYATDNNGQFSAVPATAATHYKRIVIVIYDPQGNPYSFTAIRGNY